MVDLEFVIDPEAFLRRAGSLLAADPVIATVVASVTERVAAEDRAGVPRDPVVPRWWLLVRDKAGRVVGAAMRTAPEPPHALFLLPMPDQAAVQLAQELHGRGEPATGLNGALPATRLCADELARLTGARVEVAQHTRLLELEELVPARPVPGRLRRAGDADLDLVVEWFMAFHEDADEQAGRPPGRRARRSCPGADALLRRIRGGLIWLWVDTAGERVHLTGTNPPGFGVVPDRPRLHATGAAGAGLGQRCGRGGVRAAGGRGHSGVPVHRPGQPDLQRHLPGAGLPAGGRHGEPVDRGHPLSR